MRKVLSLGSLVLWCLASATALASEEEIMPWREVAVVAEVHEYGAVRVEAKVEGDHLVFVRVTLASGAVIEVPAAGLVDLAGPQLAQLQVRYEVGYDPVPWLYVVIPFGDPVMVGTEVRWNEASFAVQGDRFVRRSTKLWAADGTFAWNSLDFP